MKRCYLISTIFLMLLVGVNLSFAQTANQPLPVPTGMVNDYANVIEDAVQSQIEQKLRDFKSTSNPQVEISVVTVKTTGERPIFEYSLNLARSWKIGSKDDDNPSALLIVAIDDKKYFTQISKDLEDELPDGIIGSLNRQYLVPAFKQANYTKGISDTVDAYIAKIKERASEPSANQTETKDEKTGLGLGCCILIFILIVFILIVVSLFGGKGGSGGTGSGDGNDRWRSGGFGGNTSNNSSPIIFWGGGGGSSNSDWGSSSGGGGDSWGGFGGGGDFGGGGSGGDW